MEEGRKRKRREEVREEGKRREEGGRKKLAVETYSSSAFPHCHSLVESHPEFVLCRLKGSHFPSRPTSQPCTLPTEKGREERERGHIFCASRATFTLPPVSEVPTIVKTT